MSDFKEEFSEKTEYKKKGFQKGNRLGNRGRHKSLINAIEDRVTIYMTIPRAMKDIAKEKGLNPAELFTLGFNSVLKDMCCPTCKQEFPEPVKERLRSIVAAQPTFED